MRKRQIYLPLIMVLCTLLSCTNQPADSYTITVNLTGVEDGTVLELIPGATHKEEKAIAEAELVNGKAVFTGQTDEPRLFLIRVKDSFGTIKVMTENGTISVKANAEKGEVRDTPSYTFNEVEITGSPVHKEYLKKSAVKSEMDQLYKQKDERFSDLNTRLRAAYEAKDTVLINSLRESDEYKQLLQADTEFFQTVERRYTEEITGNGDSFWGPLLMLDLMSYLTDQQKEWFDSFTDEAKESYYGQLVKEELYPVGFPGNKVPGFTISEEQGSGSLSSLSAGKKYILIDFWASWCNPCRKEIPNLKKQYELYAAKGFEIISISIDRNEKDWQKALEEEQLPWPNFLDTNGIADLYKVKLIPAMFLIDQNGTLVSDKLRGEELANTLKSLFE